MDAVANTPDRKKLLKELMEYDFTLQELILFLDTHPNDCAALDMYHDIQAKCEQAKARYEQYFGALCSSKVKDTDQWTWTRGPWPWEN